MEHIDMNLTSLNCPAADLSPASSEQYTPQAESILAPSDLIQPKPLHDSSVDVLMQPVDRVDCSESSEKENLPQIEDKQRNPVQEPHLEVTENISENVGANNLSHQKQSQSIQKQSQSKLLLPKKKLLDFSDISIRKLPKFINQSSSDKETPNWFLIDQDQEDQYYYQDDDDEDQILAMEDDPSNSEDSDDQQASDDSLPSDYDQDELDRNLFFGVGQRKDYSKNPQEFIEHYEFQRKVLEDQEIHIRNYQQINGVSVLPLDLQIEKEALNQSTLDFFNRNYLTYLELNGGKKTKKGSEGLSSAQSTPTQEQQRQEPQEEKKVEEVVPSAKEKPKKRSVIFRQTINMKCFKDDEEVTQMNQKQQALQEINHMQKQAITRRIIPMSQQMLRQTSLLMMKQPKPVSIPILQSTNGHSKDNVQKEAVSVNKSKDNSIDLDTNKAQEMLSIKSNVEKQNQTQISKKDVADQNPTKPFTLEQMIKENSQKEQEMIFISTEPGPSELQDQKALRQSEEQSQPDQLENMDPPSLMKPIHQAIQAQEQ